MRRPWMLVALLALLPARRAFGDEPAAPPEPAPAAQAPPADPAVAGPLAQLEQPAGPVDLAGLLATLEAQVARFQVPPARTAHDRALYDAWTSILAPRAARMAGRVGRLAEPRRWTLAPDGRTRLLAPEAWDLVVREAAALYTELDGALKQYEGFRVNFVPLPGAQPAGPPDPNRPAHALSSLEAMEAALQWKVATGQVVWQEELVVYWGLVRHAEATLRRYEEDLARWEGQVAATQDLQARIAYGLSFQRQTLSLQLFSLRAMLAALQAAEEDRLRGLVAALPAESSQRAPCEALLSELRTARNAAEAHRGVSAAGWGSLLRSRWMAPRGKLLALLAAAQASAAARTK